MSISQFSHLNSSVVTTQHMDTCNSELNMCLDFKHDSPSCLDVAQIETFSFEFPTDQVPQITTSLVEGQDNIDRGNTDQIKFNEGVSLGVEGTCNGGSYDIETSTDELADQPGITASCSTSSPVRKKTSTQWSEDEHKLFIIGLKKYGKGDWRSISRKYVKTRSSTQVASHAQKFFMRHESATRRKRSSIHDIVMVDDDDSIVALLGKGLLSRDQVLSHVGQQRFVHLLPRIDEPVANIASNTQLESHAGQQHCMQLHEQYEANIASNTQLESHVGQQHCIQFDQYQQIDEASIASNTRLESHVEQQHCIQFDQYQQIDEASIASNTRLESHVGQQHCLQFHQYQQIDEASIAPNTLLESHVGQQHCLQFHQYQQIDEASIALNTRLESHAGQHCIQFHPQVDEANIASNTRLESRVRQQHCVQFHHLIDEVNLLNTRLNPHVGQFHQQTHVGQQHCLPSFHQQIDEVNLASNIRLESHIGQQHCTQFHQINGSNIASNTRLGFHTGQQHYVPLHQPQDMVMLQDYQDYCGTNTSSSSSFETQLPWDPFHQLHWPSTKK